ncbi:hypothetical protein DAMA08_019160 [Martiniozyma asiatica (nom. inval.)]|nr:hypothetical protein DAMA08_019160 [Martiniozyma asiatica]
MDSQFGAIVIQNTPKLKENVSVLSVSNISTLSAESQTDSDILKNLIEKVRFDKELTDIFEKHQLDKFSFDISVIEYLNEIEQISDNLFENNDKDVIVSLASDDVDVDCPFDNEHKKYFELSSELLRYFYMRKFIWDRDLLKSLRFLCDRLFLKGEAQWIDKIIASFAKSWYIDFSMPQCLFGNELGVYIVSYSIVLLNSDLHTQVENESINQNKFVNNTLNALSQNKVEFNSILVDRKLKNYYDSLLVEELHLVGITNISPSNKIKKSTSKRKNLIGAKTIQKMEGTVELVSGQTQITDGPFGFVKILNDKSPVATTFTIKEESEIKNSNFESEIDISLVKEGIQTVLLHKRDDNPMSNFLFPKVDEPISTTNSFINKFIIKDKIESKKLFVVVSECELRIFSFDQSLTKANSDGKGAGNWTEYATCLIVVDLANCLAEIIEKPALMPPKISRFSSNVSTSSNSSLTSRFNDQFRSKFKLNKNSTFGNQDWQFVNSKFKPNRRQTYWKLTLPYALSLNSSGNDSIERLLFATGSRDTAQEFVNTCNYWSALKTAIPNDLTLHSKTEGEKKNITEPLLFTGVNIYSSIEYGFSPAFINAILGPHDLALSTKSPLNNELHLWKPLLQTIQHGKCDTSNVEQIQIHINQLRKYVDYLNMEVVRQDRLLITTTNLLKSLDTKVWIRRRQDKQEKLKILCSNYSRRLGWLKGEVEKGQIYLSCLTGRQI